MSFENGKTGKRERLRENFKLKWIKKKKGQIKAKSEE
jgi:hypothetical protein